jgi:diguanylate cyclase (GGDEF)-like protein/PAS domain S-box-containing protein
MPVSGFASPRFLTWLLSVLLLFAGSIGTWVYWLHVKEQEEQALARAFHVESERIIANITHQLDSYQVAMRGMKGLFSSSEHVSYQEFHNYFSSLASHEYLKGIKGIAYVVQVERDQLAQHTSVIQRELPVEYRVFPESELSVLAPIIYIEPRSGSNALAIGFDIFTNPVARMAAELARDKGELVITQPLSLVQDATVRQTPSFVMYLPVYRPGQPITSVIERRQALMGWIDIPFRMTDFMAYLSSRINPLIDIEIRDLNASEGATVLFTSDDIPHADRQLAGELVAQHELAIGNRVWTLLFSTTPAFGQAMGPATRSDLVLVAGLSFTFAVSLLIFIVASSRDQSERRAARLSHLYHALSEVNQAIVRMDSEAELFPLVCRMAVDFGGMKMAWIGQVQSDDGMIDLVASAGEILGSINQITASIRGDLPEGQGPAGRALRENREVIVNDYFADASTQIWRQRARDLGWLSSAYFPIARGGKPFAVLSVYHSQKNAFDDDTITLLREMSGDISFALDNFDRENQRQAFEQALVESEDKLSAILDNVGACIFMKDIDSRYVYVNQQTLDLWGVSQQEVIGAGDEKFFDDVTVDAILEGDRRVLQLGERVEIEEFETVRNTGRTISVWTIKIPLRDVSGNIYGLCGISTDISDKKRREEQIHYLSSFDSVTGLPNREILSEQARLALAAAKASEGAVSLLCINLDRFKIINESLGYNAGDLVLKTLAQRLSARFHLNATLSRYGGDAFFLLLPQVEVEQAKVIATSLLRLISEPFELDDRRLSLTASAGIASYPEHGRSFEHLLQCADAALAKAKEKGRNNVQVFADVMRAQVDETLNVENELREALEQKQFVLHYQPQADIHSGRIIGLEALVRWQHPRLGLLSPDRFIPIAEESGLIIELGNWVIDQAINQQVTWVAEGIELVPIAVNLSVLQLYRDNFSASVQDMLVEHRLTQAMLEFEITERLAMEHSSRTITTLGQLQAMGITLAIDDFGTGYSSLSYLKRYPIHKLKIDKSFVDGLADNPEDQAIVSAIIGIANGLGFKTIAEGVETDEQLNFLRQHGCDAYQGFLFSKPVPAEEVVTLLAPAPNLS